MPRTQFIEHRGQRILLLDFSHLETTPDALAAIAEAKRVVAAQPKQGNLLTLTHVTGSHFDTEVVKALRDLVEHNKPWVRAGAVVGLSGLMRVVFTTLIHLTGRNLKAFDDLESAKSYLAELA